MSDHVKFVYSSSDSTAGYPMAMIGALGLVAVLGIAIASASYLTKKVDRVATSSTKEKTTVTPPSPLTSERVMAKQVPKSRLFGFLKFPLRS